MAKTYIIFVRHGDVKNPQNVVYGRLPGFPLSEIGKTKITNLLTQKLKNIHIDAVYSSPLHRTLDSAQIIAKSFHRKVHISPLITEVKSKAVEGILAQKFHDEIEPNFYTDKWQSQGIESIESIKNRMTEFVKEIAAKYPGKTILAASHGDPIVILRSYIDKSPFDYKYKISHYIQKGDYFILEITDQDPSSMKIVKSI